MSKILALNLSGSEDGYLAGPNHSLDEPLGKNGTLLHEWVFPTRGFHNIGATIMGLNMFAPSFSSIRFWGTSLHRFRIAAPGVSSIVAY
mgnify:FL=1